MSSAVIPMLEHPATLADVLETVIGPETNGD
jgi:hypothetical protein